MHIDESFYLKNPRTCLLKEIAFRANELANGYCYVVGKSLECVKLQLTPIARLLTDYCALGHPRRQLAST